MDVVVPVGWGYATYSIIRHLYIAAWIWMVNKGQVSLLLQSFSDPSCGSAGLVNHAELIFWLQQHKQTQTKVMFEHSRDLGANTQKNISLLVCSDGSTMFNPIPPGGLKLDSGWTVFTNWYTRFRGGSHTFTNHHLWWHRPLRSAPIPPLF